MKVILVNGSPRKNGSTNRALLEISNELTAQNIESEIFWIGKKPLGGCIACKKCAKKNDCVFDDSVNEFRHLAKDTDGFVFASPVHYASMGGDMTSFMDRAFYSESLGNNNESFRLKPAAIVAVARRAGTTSTLDQIAKYPMISEMPLVSSSYWNMVHGATPEDVEQDAEGLFTMRNIATNMAYLLKCKESAMKQGVEQPAKLAKPWTNFIR